MDFLEKSLKKRLYLTKFTLISERDNYGHHRHWAMWIHSWVPGDWLDGSLPLQVIQPSGTDFT